MGRTPLILIVLLVIVGAAVVWFVFCDSPRRPMNARIGNADSESPTMPGPSTDGGVREASPPHSTGAQNRLTQTRPATPPADTDDQHPNGVAGSGNPPEPREDEGEGEGEEALAVDITGRVVRKSDGTPIAGVGLYLFGHRPYPGQADARQLGSPAARTDGAGCYTIRGASGTRFICAVHDEWQPEAALVPRPRGGSTTIEVRDLQLEAGGQIRLRVVDPDGQPVSGALVTVTCGGSHDRTTGADGRASCGSLAPDVLVLLTVEHRNYQPLPRGELFVAAGSIVEREVTLHPLVAIRVHVENEDGQPVADAHVSGGYFNNQYRTEAFTDEDGNADVKVGGLILSIKADGYLRRDLFPEDLPTQPVDDPIRVVLTRGMSVVGRVVHNGEPVADARISADVGGYPGADSAVDGTFRIHQIPAGRHTFSVSAGQPLVRVAELEVDVPVGGELDLGDIEVELPDQPGTRIILLAGDGSPFTGSASIVLDREDGSRPDRRNWEAGMVIPALADGVTVRARAGQAGCATWGPLTGRPPAEIELRLRPWGAVIGEVVTSSGAPVTGVRLTLTSARDPNLHSLLPGDAKTDDRGAFRLDQVLPGEWVLMVNGRPVDEVVGADPGARTEPVRVRHGQSVHRRVVLPDSQLLRGRVLGADGRALTIRVEVSASLGGTVMADTDGRFAVPVGATMLTVHVPDGVSYFFPVRSAPVTNGEVELRLPVLRGPEAGTLVVRAVLPTGELADSVSGVLEVHSVDAAGERTSWQVLVRDARMGFGRAEPVQLPPGQYHVWLRNPPPGTATDRVQVVIRDGQTSNAQLEVAPASELRLRLSRPVTGFATATCGSHSVTARFGGRFGATDQVVFDGLIAGRAYDIEIHFSERDAEGNPLRGTAEMIDVAIRGAETELSVTLPPGEPR